MRVLIIGAGAVGLGLAAFLIQGSNDVVFLARGKTKESLQANGFVVSGIFGSFSVSSGQFGVIDGYEYIDNGFDYILITSKTLANREIADNLCRIRDRIKDSKIVVIQNGWGNSEVFLDCFGEDSVFTSRIITGFYRKSLSNIDITVHADSMVLGNIFNRELSSSISDLSDALNRGGFDTKISMDVDKHLWAKMLYNCALNPLGAILDVEYGKLAESQHSRSIMNNIIDEVFWAMRLGSHSTFWQKKEYLELFYGKLIPSTYSHKSSMLQDLLNKRRTEIDSLNGVVVELGRKFQIELPYNSFIVDTIKSKEDMF